MDSTTYIFITLGMMFITFSLRFAVIGAAGKFHMPANMQQALEFVPVSVLTALIATSTFFTDNHLATTVLDPKILALTVCCLCSLRFGLVSTVIAGMGSYWLFLWVL